MACSLATVKLNNDHKPTFKIISNTAIRFLNYKHPHFILNSPLKVVKLENTNHFAITKCHFRNMK